jgi:Uma2 family endonuclease
MKTAAVLETPQSVLVCEPTLAERLIAERRELGHDRYDEIWDGVYVMSPLANNEHQYLVGRFSLIYSMVLLTPDEGLIFPGCNVSDRIEQWEHNYRCPDVAVFLTGNLAQDCGTHWFMGPDHAVEIASKGDRSRDKIGFYNQVNVRELLIVSRDPWGLELFQRKDGDLQSVGVLEPGSAGFLASIVMPLQFRLLEGTDRPKIEIRTSDGKKSWTI